MLAAGAPRCLIVILVLLILPLVGSGSAHGAPTTGRSTVRDSINDYPIVPGDELEITIVALPDQSRSVVVRDDGGIYMPLFGNLRAAGLTVDQLKQSLESRLTGTLKIHTVLIGLKKGGAKTMVVLGEVIRQGQVNLPPNASLTDALALAGGPTQAAGLTDAILVRGSTSTVVSLVPPPPGVHVEPVPVQAGDVLYVRAAPRVTVVGEVMNPGVITLRNGSITVWDAIVGAGGPKSIAALQRVRLVRAAQLETRTLDLGQGATSADAMMPLHDGDALSVLGRKVLVVGTGTTAKGGLVPLTGNENLLEILVSAGFVQDTRSLSHVAIIRKDVLPDGSRKIDSVDLQAFIKKGVPPKMAPLEDGDIIVVNPPPRTDFWQILSTLLIIRGLIP